MKIELLSSKQERKRRKETKNLKKSSSLMKKSRLIKMKKKRSNRTHSQHLKKIIMRKRPCVLQKKLLQAQLTKKNLAMQKRRLKSISLMKSK